MFFSSDKRARSVSSLVGGLLASASMVSDIVARAASIDMSFLSSEMNIVVPGSFVGNAKLKIELAFFVSTRAL